MKVLHKFRIIFIFFFIFPQIITSLLIYKYIYQSVTSKIFIRYKTEMEHIKDDYLEVFQYSIEKTLKNLSNEFDYTSFKNRELFKLSYDILPWETLISFTDSSGESLTTHKNPQLHQVYIKNYNPIITKNVYWNLPQLSNYQNKIVISATLSIFDTDNNYLGNLLIESPITYFLEKFKSEANKKQIKLVLINHNKIAVLLNRSANETIEYSNHIDVQSIISNVENNHNVKIDNRKFITTTTYIELFDMYLIGLIPQQIISDEVLPTISIVMFIFLILTALYIYLIRLLGHKILNSIENINNHLFNIKVGDFTPQNYLNTKDELNSINRNINNLAHDLNSKITLRQNIFDVISHNSASPITMLINMSQILSATHPDKDIYKDMFNASEEIKGFIYNILTYISIDRGLDKQFKTLNVKGILDELLNIYQFKLSNRKVTIDCEVEENLFINGDYHLLRSILENIIDNILRHIKGRNSFSIRMKKEDQKVYIIISGLTKENADLLSRDDKEIFKNSSNSYNHEAINLYIIKTLTYHMAGDVTIENNNDTNSITLGFPSINSVD